MPRKRAGAPRAEDGSNGDSRLVAFGAVRAPNEVDALSVDLTIDDFEITMRAGRAKIGSWLRSTVKIQRIDETSFEFIAEGDRLIFVPEDPATFGQHPAVGEPEDDKLRRRREKEEGRAAKKAAKKADTAAKAAKKAEGRDEKRSSRRASSEELPGSDWKPGETDPAAEPEPTGDSDDVSEEREDDANQLWIRALDTARKYDLFGLDRVPIDENLRGQEHEHTWDHRVAVESGVGNRICTICGKIRR